MWLLVFWDWLRQFLLCFGFDGNFCLDVCAFEVYFVGLEWEFGLIFFDERAVVMVWVWVVGGAVICWLFGARLVMGF